METFESRNRIVQGTGVNKSISPDKPQQTANTSVAKQRRRKKNTKTRQLKIRTFLDVQQSYQDSATSSSCRKSSVGCRIR